MKKLEKRFLKYVAVDLINHRIKDGYSISYYQEIPLHIFKIFHTLVFKMNKRAANQIRIHERLYLRAVGSLADRNSHVVLYDRGQPTLRFQSNKQR